MIYLKTHFHLLNDFHTLTFDSIDQNLLFYKIDCMSIKDTSLQWFKRYQSERKQFASLSNQTSYEHDEEYGVVQGSTLAPFIVIFNIHK